MWYILQKYEKKENKLCTNNEKYFFNVIYLQSILYNNFINFYYNNFKNHINCDFMIK